MQFERNLSGLLELLVLSCSTSSQHVDIAPSKPGFNVFGNGNDQTSAYDGGVTNLTVDQVAALKRSACTGWSQEGERLPAILDFVVDVSGSMSLRSATSGDQTKWDITQSALRNALDALPSTTAVGMVFFPNRSLLSASTPKQ